MSKTKRIEVVRLPELSKKGALANNQVAIKELKKEFLGIGEVKGYKFSQIYKTSQAFIYEVSYDRGKHYEVFKRRVNSRFGCISYPTSKGFGIWAWTYSTLDKAIEKFNQLEFNTIKPVEKSYLNRTETMKLCRIYSFTTLWSWTQKGILTPKALTKSKPLYLKQDIIDYLNQKNNNNKK